MLDFGTNLGGQCLETSLCIAAPACSCSQCPGPLRLLESQLPVVGFLLAVRVLKHLVSATEGFLGPLSWFAPELERALGPQNRLDASQNFVGYRY